MIESPYNFNTVKVVVFMEKHALTDSFNQIMLTHESLVRVLDALQKEMKPGPNGSFEVVTDDTDFIFQDIKQDFLPEEMLN